MTVHVSIATDLSLLTEALADPATDLTVELDTLAAHCAAAVDSFLGLSITAALDPQPFHVEVPAPGGRTGIVLSSLAFAVPPETDELPTVTVVVLAGTPGSLVDLGADLGHLFDLRPELIELDRHLVDTAGRPVDASLADVSTVNQAIGVLIGQGADPVTASTVLASAAAVADTTLVVAAAAVLASVLPAA